MLAFLYAASSAQYSLDEHSDGGGGGQVTGDVVIGVVTDVVELALSVVVVELAGVAVVEVELVVVIVVVVVVNVGVVDGGELVVQTMSPRVSTSPDLMNFMQYANDPTMSGLRHCFFTLFAFLDAAVIFLQSPSIV